MALIVEDGTGVANADSYNELADIADYAARFGLTWDGTQAQQEAAARNAAIYLDIVYGKRIGGTRVSQGQALLWPLYGVRDYQYESYPADTYGWSGGDYVPSNTIPQAWKDAHCEMSVRARVENILPDVTESGSLESKDIQVGPIRVAKTWAGGTSPIKWYRKVELMLKRYLGSGTELQRA